LEGHGMGYMHGLKMLFIKLDFEKVDDDIEWPFILAMLWALGFAKFFV
jgi:hypothetical protein